MKSILFLVVFAFGVSFAQDWSVVSKYYPGGFSAQLDTLTIPEIPDNSVFYGYGNFNKPRQIDYFAEYQGKETYPRRIWWRFDMLLFQFMVQNKGSHFEIKVSHATCKDSLGSHDWSNSKDPRDPTTMTLHADPHMDWIDIDYMTSDFKPWPYPYPYPQLRPIRWDIDSTSPRQGTYQEWLYDKRGKHQQIRFLRGYGKRLLDFDIRTDAQGRDTLVKVRETWHRQLPGKADSITRTGPVALHRIRYNSQGQIEFQMIDENYDSMVPFEKQNVEYDELFTHQVYVYDKKGRNVARVQLRPYNRGILALTAMRFDAKDRVVRKTTYLVKDNKTVGDWVETVEWEYDSLCRTIRKSQYCHEALIKVLRKQPDTKWYYWENTRW